MKNLILIIVILTNTMNAQNNILLQPWKGKYGGVPAFDQYKVSDFKPAILDAIKIKLKEIEKISHNSESANFSNTIEELEKSGQVISRINTIFEIYSSTITSEDFQVLEHEITPLLSDLQNQIYQNEKLFNRIEAVYNSLSVSHPKLNQEQQRLVELYYTNFVREGAKLDQTNKIKVAEINQKLAVLFTKFSQNLLAEENNFYLELKTENDFEGLSAEFISAAKNAAKEKNLSVLGCIPNTRSSIEPFLTYSTKRELRQKAFEIFVKRGDNSNPYNNNEIALEILKLRNEKAKLLGFPSFAHWSLSNTMAQKPERTMELMLSVWKPAIEKVQSDVAEMQKIVDKEGGSFKIAPWDYRYYAEKVRKEKYDLNQNDVKPYLQLEKLREGMFWVAGEIFNLSFKQITSVPVYHPDVRVWEVYDEKSKKIVGLWYFDPYARNGKRSGAWMSSYREQQKLMGDIIPIVSNNCNFIKGNANEPVLISWDDANTLFHEFGHALHGLMSNVTYHYLSDTNVPRDYVEFPSQIMERWLSTPELLNKFALHYKTGIPLPFNLVEKLNRAATFNEGFSTVETISSALVDMKLHLTSDINNLHQFEVETLNSLKMPSQIVMRHRIPQFAHIFSGNEYAAGYYSYLWSDVISADAYEAFTENNGPYDKAIAKKIVDYVFSIGNSIDPSIAYEKFRSKKPTSDALMRARNFPILE